MKYPTTRALIWEGVKSGLVPFIGSLAIPAIPAFISYQFFGFEVVNFLSTQFLALVGCYAAILVRKEQDPSAPRPNLWHAFFIGQVLAFLALQIDWTQWQYTAAFGDHAIAVIVGGASRWHKEIMAWAVSFKPKPKG